MVPLKGPSSPGPKNRPGASGPSGPPRRPLGLALEARSPSSGFKGKAKISSSRGEAGGCRLFGPRCARFWFGTSHSRPPVGPRKEMSCAPREGRAHLQGPCPQVVKGKALAACGTATVPLDPPDRASGGLPLRVPAALAHPGPPPTPVFTKRVPPHPPQPEARGQAWGLRDSSQDAPSGPRSSGSSSPRSSQLQGWALSAPQISP